MNQLTERKQTTKMVLLFTITYMVSYITRINYGAVIAEMERATQLSKSLLSLAVTGSFITYGAGQVISGLCGDRFSPKKLVFCGLGLTVLMNLLIPFCTNHYQMMVVWCINGFAQAFMWPPMVRLMSGLFSEEDYKKASVKVSWGSSFGTILVYLCAPVLITISSYKLVFFVSAFCGVLMMVLWQLWCQDVEQEKKSSSARQEKIQGGTMFSPLFIGIMLAIVLQGMLRDGVTTWMPSYIGETYNLSSAISILTGVVLPVFSILSFQVSSDLYRRVFKNPLFCSGVFFGFGMVSAVVLLLLSGRSAVLSVLCSALLTGAMHGVNLILICMIPPYFKQRGNVSTVSGVLNSCTYVGSACSTYGIALLTEKFNWSITLFIWLCIAILGTTLCFLCSRPWGRQFPTDEGLEV